MGGVFTGKFGEQHGHVVRHLAIGNVGLTEDMPDQDVEIEVRGYREAARPSSNALNRSSSSRMRSRLSSSANNLTRHSAAPNFRPRTERTKSTSWAVNRARQFG